MTGKLLRTLTLFSHLFYLQGATGYWFDPSPAFWKSAIFIFMTGAYLTVNAVYIWSVLRGKSL
jgi:hypothetical protein